MPGESTIFLVVFKGSKGYLSQPALQSVEALEEACAPLRVLFPEAWLYVTKSMNHLPRENWPKSRAVVGVWKPDTPLLSPPDEEGFYGGGDALDTAAAFAYMNTTALIFGGRTVVEALLPYKTTVLEVSLPSEEGAWHLELSLHHRKKLELGTVTVYLPLSNPTVFPDVRARIPREAQELLRREQLTTPGADGDGLEGEEAPKQAEGAAEELKPQQLVEARQEEHSAARELQEEEDPFATTDPNGGRVRVKPASPPNVFGKLGHIAQGVQQAGTNLTTWKVAQGVKGEEATAAALEELARRQPHIAVCHSLPMTPWQKPGSPWDLDHVVLIANCVYFLDTKYWTPALYTWENSDQVRLNPTANTGKTRGDTLRPIHMVEPMAAWKKYLQERNGGMGVSEQGLVVVTNTREQLVELDNSRAPQNVWLLKLQAAVAHLEKEAVRLQTLPLHQPHLEIFKSLLLNP